MVWGCLSGDVFTMAIFSDLHTREEFLAVVEFFDVVSSLWGIVSEVGVWLRGPM